MKNVNNLLISVIVLMACSSPHQKKEVQSRPNVLFIAVDDLRPELNFFGATQIKSPNLDKLASQSLVFSRAYCNVPVCGASRTSLLTGARPTRNRFITYSTKKDEEVPEMVSLPMCLKNNGYTTISNGKVFHHGLDDSLAWNEIWHPAGDIRDYATVKNLNLNSQPGLRGYPYEAANVGDSAYWDGKIANKAIEDLRKLKDKEEPFFLAVGFMKPHLPFNAPTKYWDMYPSETISLPASYDQPASTPAIAYHNSIELRYYYGIPKEGFVSNEMALKLIHGYYACVSYVDAQIGRILDELERIGLAENTIIILWGDHGYNLGEHKLWCKHCTFETALKAPLMLKVPGKTKGTRSDAITEYIDIYPSICDLTGCEKPAQLEGESFAGLLSGQSRQKDYAVSKYEDAVALIKGSLLYTEWTDSFGVKYDRMLFDHSTDPLELDNLAENEEYKQLVDQLSAELHEKWGRDFLN